MATAEIQRQGDVTAQAFAVVAGRLADVRGAMDDLLARLHDLAAVLTRQRADSDVLDGVADAARHLCADLGRGEAAADPTAIGPALRDAERALAEIDQRARILRSVGTLTLVTARSLGDTAFDTYIAGLTRLVATMMDEARALGAAVGTVRARRAEAARHFRQAARSVAGVVRGLDASAPDRARLDRSMSEGLAQAAALATDLPAVARDETTALITAMQFADNMAQRLVHVWDILALQDARGPAVGALAGAQLQALVADTDRTRQDTALALARLSSAASEAARLLDSGPQEADGPAAAIALSRRVLADAARGAARAETGIAGAAAQGGAIRDVAQDAAARFDRVAQATAAIDLAAINAALLAGRNAELQRALRVLTAEVRDNAVVCRRATAVCRGAIARLSAAEDLASFAAVTEQACTFQAQVAAAGRAVDGAGIALEKVDALRHAARTSLARLTEASRAAQGALDSVQSAARDLARVADALPPAAAPGADGLEDLMILYTMERERAVHRQLFGLPEAPPPATAAPQSEDDALAAILF